MFFVKGIQLARGMARHADCMNNLMQISLALMSYESEHGSFPPGGRITEDGQPAQSWRVAILPCLDKDDLYQRYDSSQP